MSGCQGVRAGVTGSGDLAEHGATRRDESTSTLGGVDLDAYGEVAKVLTHDGVARLRWGRGGVRLRVRDRLGLLTHCVVYLLKL